MHIHAFSKYSKTHEPPAPPTCAITCAIMLLPFFANRHQHASMRRPQFLPYFMCKLMQFHKISQECAKNVADNYCTRFVHNTHALAQNSLKDFTWVNITLNLYFFSLQTTFSPHMPLTHLISVSVQALAPKLYPCPLLALISSLVTLTTPTH